MCKETTNGVLKNVEQGVQERWTVYENAEWCIQERWTVYTRTLNSVYKNADAADSLRKIINTIPYIQMVGVNL